MKTKDHLGNQYRSQNEMLNHYGIKASAFKYRLNNGWNLEDALTISVEERGITDHHGNQYPSIEKMCDAYNISVSLYNKYKNKGYDLTKILTLQKEPVYDHLGNKFDSYAAIERYYGLRHGILTVRLQKGWSIKDAITKPAQNSKFHIGESVMAKCGLKCTLTGKHGYNFVAQFEDGTITHVHRSTFLRGEIGHPQMKRRHLQGFAGFTGKYLATNDDMSVYYECECSKCGYKGILTPQQMIEHSKTHDQRSFR